MKKKEIQILDILPRSEVKAAKKPEALMEELIDIQKERQRLDEKENLLLRNLRSRVGRSFKIDGHHYQIRRRNHKFFLCRMDGAFRDLSDDDAA